MIPTPLQFSLHSEFNCAALFCLLLTQSLGYLEWYIILMISRPALWSAINQKAVTWAATIFDSWVKLEFKPYKLWHVLQYQGIQSASKVWSWSDWCKLVVMTNLSSWWVSITTSAGIPSTYSITSTIGWQLLWIPLLVDDCAFHYLLCMWKIVLDLAGARSWGGSNVRTSRFWLRIWLRGECTWHQNIWKQHHDVCRPRMLRKRNEIQVNFKQA